MKPDIEINGRYFIEGRGYGNYEETLTFISILNSDLDDFSTDYNKEINGKCWVELEKTMPSAKAITSYDAGKDVSIYSIKLDQSGKAVVLTELPKKGNECYVCGKETYDMTYTICDNCINKKPKQQSPDELAEKVFEEIVTNDPNSMTSFPDIFYKAMQEYHRRMIHQELCDFFVEIYYQISKGNISTKNTPEQIVNKWLESRKENK